MVALLRCLWGLDLHVVAHEFRVVLVRIAAKKSVIALKSATQGPAVVVACRRGLFGWRQMPFAERVGVVAILQQYLGKKAVLEWYLAVGTRKPLRAFRDTRHSVRVMISPVDET